MANVSHYAWLMFTFLVETGFGHVALAGLELLDSSYPLTLASQSAGITGIKQLGQLEKYLDYMREPPHPAAKYSCYLNFLCLH